MISGSIHNNKNAGWKEILAGSIRTSSGFQSISKQIQKE
jgi:hypothetical protein